MSFDVAITRATKNIATFGDTDVFPFPFENHIFFDAPARVEALLKKVHGEFGQLYSDHPPSTIEALAQVGYTGFRWVSLIEPFWNAYYLSLVLSLSDQIEAQRVPLADRTVFSYRFDPDSSSSHLFLPSTWLDYRRHALAESSKHSYVVVTDIADFYPRIYHHRIDNALRRLPNPRDIPSRIMAMLKSFAGNVSYGLPIGGPASRILAELALADTDLHLVRRHVKFCRYADDYCLFCDSKSDAYAYLVLLSEKLVNEGLVLQKNKTRIYTADEFRDLSRLLDPATIDDPLASEEQKLLHVSIRFDPYSSTGEEDYLRIKAAIQQIDILGILSKELAKTEIDQAVTKQAIAAIRALDKDDQEGAIRTLLDPHNMQVLSPVFVTLMRTIRNVYSDLEPSTQTFVDEALVKLYESGDPILRVEVNLSYFVQVFSLKRGIRKEEILIELFEKPVSPLIRRMVVVTMASWGAHYWLSDQKEKYLSYSVWERRALILASYALGDEGSHWRDYWKKSWGPFDTAVRDWASERFQKANTFPLP